MTNIIKNNIYLFSYLNILIIAFLFRFIDLGNRAVHHDESLHGYFSFVTSNGDYYSHNPLTHGMFLFNILSGVFWILGSNDFLLRLPFAIAGLLIVLSPVLIRKEIGDKSTLLIAFLISISPSLAYFSRFARNDVFMSVILIMLFIFILKYVNTKKEIWLFQIVGIIALGFTIKESMYLNLLGVLIFLSFYSFKDLLNVALGKISIIEINHITKLFLILSLITIPLAAPMLSVFQSSLGVILSTPESYPGIPAGLPVGNGIVVAVIITFLLFLISNIFGFMIDKKLWFKSISIFLIIFILMFTTFFINPSGIITGHWQSLGYWLSQHDVARGGQPYYYYIIILFTNEFLIFFLGLPLSIYYLTKGEFFERFLSFTAIFSLVAFSLAGEKMPWLMINLVIPFIFLVSFFISKSISLLDKSKEILLLYFVSASVIIFLTLKLIFTNYSVENNNYFYDIIFLIISILIISFSFLSKNIFSLKQFSISLSLVIFILLSLLTIKTTSKVIFDLSDEPYDMLIYTQSSNSIHQLNKEIQDSYIKKEDLIVGVDTLDGFAWPWMWYLRENKNVVWIDNIEILDHKYDYLLVNSKNMEKIPEEFLSDYNVKRTIPHRKWFPESIYRNMSINDIPDMILSNKKRVSISEYYLNRDFQTKVGDTNFVLIKSKKFESIE